MKTKKDVGKSLSDYFVLLINRFIFLGFLLLAIPFLTRILGTVGYGQLNLFILVADIAFICIVSWTSVAVFRFGKEEYIKEGRLNEVFWARNIILFFALSVSIFLILFLRREIDKYTQINLSYILVIVFLFTQTILDYNQYILQAVGKLKFSSLIKIISQLIFLILVLGMFFIGVKKVFYILVILVISRLVAMVASFKWISFGWFLPIRTNKNILKKILFFYYPLMFRAISAYIINYVDLMVIKKYLLVSDVGIYSLSYNLMRFFGQTVMVVITVTGPILIGLWTEGRQDIIKTYLKRLTPQGIFFWSIVLTISILLLPFFVPIIFGEEFSPSVMSAQILLVGLVFNGIACFYSGVLTAYKMVKLIAIVNISMAVLNLVGDVLLVPIMGIKGAAISSAISFSLGGIGYMYLGNKKLNIKEVKSIIFFVPTAITFMGMLHNVNLFILCIVNVLIYYFILITLKLFNSSDVELLNHIDMPPKIRKIIYKMYYILGVG